MIFGRKPCVPKASDEHFGGASCPTPILAFVRDLGRPARRQGRADGGSF